MSNPDYRCMRGRLSDVCISHRSNPWTQSVDATGMMSGKTPHRDTLVAEGMQFTDDDAEASGIAGLRHHTQRRGGVP
jgi:hypothetical protein